MKTNKRTSTKMYLVEVLQGGLNYLKDFYCLTDEQVKGLDKRSYRVTAVGEADEAKIFLADSGRGVINQDDINDVLIDLGIFK